VLFPGEPVLKSEITITLVSTVEMQGRNFSPKQGLWNCLHGEQLAHGLAFVKKLISRPED
jgi:hypothetical protein